MQYEKKIFEKLWETLEKLFPTIQLRWSIYNFLKPLHELWHQALIAMKITVEDFEKIVKSPRFLHLTSLNWLVLTIRLWFDT